MKWHFDDNLPIYMQIVQQIKQGMISGFYPLGSQLPTVRELADQISVNPNTVQKAMSQLEQEGLVFSQGTVGRFITNDESIPTVLRQKLADKHVSTFLVNIKALGFTGDEIIQLVKSRLEEGA